MEPYRPIDCSLHDRLEDAAVRRVPVRLRLRGGAAADAVEPAEVVTTIDDLWVRDGAEFARLGNGEVVRLDRLVHLDDTG